jgi:hypothetical protein
VCTQTFRSLKLIIAGSRDYTDYEYVKGKLDFLLSQTKDVEIICGGARGADLMGKRYGEEKGYPVRMFEARWDELGKKAGFIRNKEMAKVGTHLVAFSKNNSKGTAHMINLAKEYNLVIRVYKV